MSTTVTLEVPDGVLTQAQTYARRMQLPLETVLSDWLNRFIADFPVDALTDDEILMLCELQLDDTTQAALDDLLDARRENRLTANEQTALDGLLAGYRRGMVRKAAALKIAVERGLKPPLNQGSE